MSLRAQILEVLDSAVSPVTFREIEIRLMADGLQLKGANPLLGRLSKLRQEGVIEKAKEGGYRLPRIEVAQTPPERRLVDLLRTAFKPKALHNAVIWDATPYLELTEDGAPGRRLVFEHPAAEQVKDVVESRWGAGGAFAWVVRSKGPLGDQIWSPPRGGPSRIETGVVLVAKERLGGTGVTSFGYRAPFPERVMLEFVQMNVAGDMAAPIVRRALGAGLDVERAWMAANALGNLADLTALLAANYRRLSPKAKEAFDAKIAPVVLTNLERR